MMFKEKLQKAISERKTPLCLGIDPHSASLPPFFESYRNSHGGSQFIRKWVMSLIEVASKELPAVKFQSSFFEALGADVYALLPELMAEAKAKGLLTILDVKRCDIASTMKAYGRSAFEEIKADAMTVIPYMGLDVFYPLYEWMKRGHGVYSIFLSSNPSGFERLSSSMGQGKMVTEHFHEELFSELRKEGLEKAFGLVVGSNSYLKKKVQLKSLQEEFSFLLPGLGFQGGGVTAGLSSLASEGSSHLFPLSRALTGVGDPGLVNEIAEIKNFEAYEEFVAHRISHYKEAFLDLFSEMG